MLLTNQQLDKLAASCVVFASRGMLDGGLLAEGIPEPAHPNDEDSDTEDAPGMTSLGDVKLARYPGKDPESYVNAQTWA
jgi:hypothetical protein